MIRNYEELATTPLRKTALDIANAALASVNVASAMRACVRADGCELVIDDQQAPARRYALTAGARVTVAVFGKAAIAMAAATIERLRELSVDVDWRACVISPPSQDALPAILSDARRVSLHDACTHPLPSAANVRATQVLVALCTERDADLVLFCVSGGGSALLCAPRGSLEQLQRLNRALLACGAAIDTINVVRAAASTVKGGQLARAVARSGARFASLIVSDVALSGGRQAVAEAVASGPTVRRAAASRALARQRLAAAVTRYDLAKFIDVTAEEEDEDDEDNDNGAFFIVLSNATALTAMHRAVPPSYSIVDLGARVDGDAVDVGRRLVREAAAGDASEARAVLGCGETTVTLSRQSTGVGGRNQHTVLAALRCMQSEHASNLCVISLGTDGCDNSARIAGAIVDDACAPRLAPTAAVDDALARHDSTRFFEKHLSGRALIDTGGATGSNVADVFIAIRGETF